MKHFLSMGDLSAEEARGILANAQAMKTSRRAFEDALEKRTILILLAKPSMRTRLSFEVAAYDLGGHAISYRVDESVLGVKETYADFGAVASRYVQLIVARLHAQADLEELASRSRVPVVNGLTDHEHPCQALGDMLTMMEKRNLLGAKLAYVGDARNNVTHSLLLASALLGVDMRVAAPEGFGPEKAVLAHAQALAQDSGAAIDVTTDPLAAVKGVDFVYTDTWMSYHIPSALRVQRLEALRPYRVDAALMRASGGAWFMHCLPATRGEEVTDDVLDSPRSLVLEQAEGRLHVQKALLVALLRPTLAHLATA